MSSANSVILIRPTGFAFDPTTAETNAFQRAEYDGDVLRNAAEEFDALLLALDARGVRATVFDPIDPAAPNAVFPNNWFSTHADGTLVLYPMCSPSRRTERDPRFAERLKQEGFAVQRVVDMSIMEKADRYLEGTGSLVLERDRGLAFAAIGPRTTERALNNWCGAMGMQQVPFVATMDCTLAGTSVYHTNVVMSIGEGFAVVCLEALPYPVDRDDVWAELERANKEVIPITLEQMHCYVGNMLELRTTIGGRSERAVFLSETAFLALKPDQRMALERYADLVPVPIPTIEEVGGGSVRCMLAENYLPLV